MAVEPAKMEESARIDAVLNRPWYSLGLDPGLEEGFEAETAGVRRRQVSTYLAMLLVVTLACLPLDLQGHVLRDGVAFRVGVETPIILISLGLLRCSRPAWIEGLAGAVPVAVVLGFAVVLGSRSVPPFTDRYIMAAGMLGLFSNVVLPLRLHHTAILSVCNVTLYCVLGLSDLVATPSGQVGSLVIFFSIVMILTLPTAARRERANQDRYLFMRRDRLQNRELARVVDELSRVADRDALTDVGNRRCFDRMLDLLWGDARIEAGHLAIAMVDVDLFKSFNDAAGHAEGDRCLRAVARTIVGHVRPNLDVVTRYGGEEFAVLMPIAGDAEAAEEAGPAVLAERLRHAIEGQDLVHPGLGPAGRVTVSIGVAIAAPGRDAQTPLSLLDAADRALYQAKHDGRNRVRFVEATTLTQAA